MSTEQLNIQSITGVDIELEIAGPGSRSYAFLADWHIRVILAIAWFLIAAFISAGTLVFSHAVSPKMNSTLTLTAVLPATAIYFLYHPVLEILMNGRTPGKRMAAIRIVTTSGDTPGVGPLIVRNLFRLFDSLPVFYIVGLIATVVTRQHVRIGDMAAGTLLVLERGDTAVLTRIGSAIDTKRLSPEAAELADEILQRWDSLASDVRYELAWSFLKRADVDFNSAKAGGVLDNQRRQGYTDKELKAKIQSLLSGEPR